MQDDSSSARFRPVLCRGCGAEFEQLYPANRGLGLWALPGDYKCMKLGALKFNEQ